MERDQRENSEKSAPLKSMQVPRLWDETPGRQVPTGGKKHTRPLRGGRVTWNSINQSMAKVYRRQRLQRLRLWAKIPDKGWRPWGTRFLAWFQVWTKEAKLALYEFRLTEHWEWERALTYSCPLPCHKKEKSPIWIAGNSRPNLSGSW